MWRRSGCERGSTGEAGAVCRLVCRARRSLEKLLMFFAPRTFSHRVRSVEGTARGGDA